MNLGGFGRKRLWPNRGIVSAFPTIDWGGGTQRKSFIKIVICLPRLELNISRIQTYGVARGLACSLLLSDVGLCQHV